MKSISNESTKDWLNSYFSENIFILYLDKQKSFTVPLSINKGSKWIQPLTKQKSKLLNGMS